MNPSANHRSHRPTVGGDQGDPRDRRLWRLSPIRDARSDRDYHMGCRPERPWSVNGSCRERIASIMLYIVTRGKDKMLGEHCFPLITASWVKNPSAEIDLNSYG
jgi:hypothetical protein